MLPSLFLRTAVLFFVVGVAMGIYMGAAQNFSLVHVHVHVNLLGWVALALAGLIYGAHPRLQQGPWGLAHYVLHVAGLVIFMGGFWWNVVGGIKHVAPLALGSTMVGLGVLTFALNVWLRLSPAPRPAH